MLESPPVPATALDADRLSRLLEVGSSLVAQLDVEAVLQRLLETARQLTGARYVALGVLDAERKELERFLTAGIDDATHRAIGDLPRGRGVLGVLITDPRPLRLADVGAHPRSYGFPAGHPPMTTFLGVPVLIGGEAWGNLYLTEKADGAEFEPADEQAAVILAGWAAVAIANARLYEESEARRADLERAVAGLEATTAVARAVGSETDLGRVLQLIVKRGRALVDARAMVLLLAERDELTVAAYAGQVDPGVRGVRIPRAGTAVGDVLGAGRPERIGDVATRLALDDEGLGVIAAETALLVPMVYRGTPLGVLAAFDRLAPDPGFGAEEESIVQAFAASAGIAVATAKTVQRERLRESIAAAEGERRRWARELHDETLQALGGLRMTLSSAARRRDPERLEAAVRDAVALLESEIAGLRRLIADLRPAALDDLGLVAAIEGLRARVEAQEGIAIFARAELGDERLAPELETAIYRIVQEALTNVVKHAHARHVEIALAREGGEVCVTVADDGRGFEPDAPRAGFGLVGLAERARLVGGHAEVTSSPEGTTVRATIPAPDGAAADAGTRSSLTT
jgi:signal transduction histidine kinase